MVCVAAHSRQDAYVTQCNHLGGNEWEKAHLQSRPSLGPSEPNQQRMNDRTEQNHDHWARSQCATEQSYGHWVRSQYATEQNYDRWEQSQCERAQEWL